MPGTTRATCSVMPEQRTVYILQSERDPAQFYTGVTADIAKRLAAHNAALSKHTSKWMPWRVVLEMTFLHASEAFAFERYLKSGSGVAFAQKHLRPKPAARSTSKQKAKIVIG